MSKQTATEWLFEQIDNLIPYQNISTSQIFNGLIKQAKEMERSQIIDAWNDGNYTDPKETPTFYAEQYYNETYKKEQ